MLMLLVSAAALRYRVLAFDAMIMPASEADYITLVVKYEDGIDGRVWLDAYELN